jgi:hypothetical protein
MVNMPERWKHEGYLAPDLSMVLVCWFSKEYNIKMAINSTSTFSERAALLAALGANIVVKFTRTSTGTTGTRTFTGREAIEVILIV